MKKLHTSKNRRKRATISGVAAVVSLVAMIGGSTAASAAEPPPLVPASGCLKPNAPEFGRVTYFGPEPGGIDLRCGRWDYGVIHTDASHPIADNGDDDVNFLNCFRRILTSPNYPIPAEPGNIALRMKRGDGGTATLVYREFDGMVVTMHTSELPGGNNWYACANA